MMERKPISSSVMPSDLKKLRSFTHQKKIPNLTAKRTKKPKTAETLESEYHLFASGDVKRIETYIKTHNIHQENISVLIREDIPVSLLITLIKTKIPFPAADQMALLKLKNKELLATYSWYQPLADCVLREMLMQTHNDGFLQNYIKRRTLSPDVQKYLVRAHNIKLLRLYIERHGLCKAAQEEFLDFMAERLAR